MFSLSARAEGRGDESPVDEKAGGRPGRKGSNAKIERPGSLLEPNKQVGLGGPHPAQHCQVFISDTKDFERGTTTAKENDPIMLCSLKGCAYRQINKKKEKPRKDKHDRPEWERQSSELKKDRGELVLNWRVRTQAYAKRRKYQNREMKMEGGKGIVRELRHVLRSGWTISGGKSRPVTEILEGKNKIRGFVLDQGAVLRLKYWGNRGEDQAVGRTNMVRGEVSCSTRVREKKSQGTRRAGEIWKKIESLKEEKEFRYSLARMAYSCR